MLSKTLCFNRSFNRKAEETFNMIKPITDAQSRWLVESVVYAAYHPVRKTAYCMICGHKWKPEKMNKHLICPGCGKKLEKFTDTSKKLYSTGGIISVVNGMQIERSFMVIIWAGNYGTPGSIQFFEYKRLIMDNKGNIAMYSLSHKPFSYNYEDFIVNDKMFRRKSNMGYKQKSVLSSDPYCYYKHKSYLPEIIRNGYEYKKIPRASRMAIMQALLSNPHAETLLKAGYTDMLYKIDYEKFWPSVRIAIRNQYKPKDVQYWFDVLVMMERLKLDLCNPKYVCSSDIVTLHDNLVSRITRLNERIRIENEHKWLKGKYEQLKSKEEKASKYLSVKTKPYQNWKIEEGNVVIKPLVTVDDFKKEGMIMCHCVYTSEYHMNEGNLTATALIDGKPMETIDYNINGELQIYGKFNKHTRYHDVIRDVFEKHIKEVKKLVRRSSYLINKYEKSNTQALY